MVKLRKIIAKNIKTYRKEMGISQLMLADMIDSTSNYIAMIEAEKRFPTDTMLEKIAFALNKEPCELFMFTPIQKEWQKNILKEIDDLITQKLNETHYSNISFRKVTNIKKKHLKASVNL